MPIFLVCLTFILMFCTYTGVHTNAGKLMFQIVSLILIYISIFDDPQVQSYMIYYSILRISCRAVAVYNVFVCQYPNNLLEYRPDDSEFVRLDSSLKKNTAFVRKLVSWSLIHDCCD